LEGVLGGDKGGKRLVAEPSLALLPSPSLLLGFGEDYAVALLVSRDEVRHLAVKQYGIPIEVDVAILECKGGGEDAPAVIGEGEAVVQRLLGDLSLHIGVAPLQGYDVVQAAIVQKRAVRLAHEALIPHEGHPLLIDPGLR